MDPVKTDNEEELTSTMDNVISVLNKDEKSDTSSDATPTSSTDANIRPAASHIALDDPISSTSSDSLDQLKVKMDKGDSVAINVHRVSTDNEADLLDITNISNNEKITEDVEDLVHDLESLLGESTDSFSVTSKFIRKDTNLKSVFGNSSNDTSITKEGTDVKVDDVLQELEDFTGNATTDSAIVNVEKDSRETTVEHVIAVESTDKIKNESESTPSDVCDGKSVADQILNTIEPSGSGSSNIVTNSDDLSHQNISEIIGTSNKSPSGTHDKPTDEETTSSSDNTTQQETLCIQDQDISHSEPKEIVDNAESTTSEASKECSEDPPSKTDDVVTSSEGDPNETLQTELIDEKSDVTGSEVVKTLEGSDNTDTANKEMTKAEDVAEQCTNTEEREQQENDENQLSSEDKIECYEVSNETLSEYVEKIVDVLPSENECVNIDCTDEQNGKTDTGSVHDNNSIIEERKDDGNSNGNIKNEKESYTNKEVDSTNLQSVQQSIPHESSLNSVVSPEGSEANTLDEDATTCSNMVQEKSKVLGSEHSIEHSKISTSDSCMDQNSESDLIIEPNSKIPNSEVAGPNMVCKIAVEPIEGVDVQNEISPSIERLDSGKPSTDLEKICINIQEDNEISHSQSEESSSSTILHEGVKHSEIDATGTLITEKSANSVETETKESEQNIPIEETRSINATKKPEDSKVVESTQESQISPSLNEDVTENITSGITSKAEASDTKECSAEPVEHISVLDVSKKENLNNDIVKDTESSVPSSRETVENPIEVEDIVKQKISSDVEKEDPLDEALSEQADNADLEKMDETNINEIEINEESHREKTSVITMCDNILIEAEMNVTASACKDASAETQSSNLDVRSVFAKDDLVTIQKTTDICQDENKSEQGPVVDEDFNNEEISKPVLENSEAPDELSEEEVPNLVLEPDDENENKIEDPSMVDEIRQHSSEEIDKNKGGFEEQESTEQNEKDIKNNERAEIITTESCSLTGQENIGDDESSTQASVEEKSEETVTPVAKDTYESVDKSENKLSENKQEFVSEHIEASISPEEPPSTPTTEIVTGSSKPDTVEIDPTEMALQSDKKAEPDEASASSAEPMKQSNIVIEEKCDEMQTEPISSPSVGSTGFESSEVQVKIPSDDIAEPVNECDENIETPTITIVEKIGQPIESSSAETDKSSQPTNIEELADASEPLEEASETAESVEPTEEAVTSEQVVETQSCEGTTILSNPSENAIEASEPKIEQSRAEEAESVDQSRDEKMEPTESQELLCPVTEPSVPVTELSPPVFEPTDSAIEPSKLVFEGPDQSKTESTASIVEPSGSAVKSSEAVVEPSESAIQPSESVVEQTETTMPIVKSCQSAVEHSEPLVQPSRAVLELSEPKSSEHAAESSEPVAESSEPVAKSSEPVAESYELVEKSSQLVAESSEPVAKSSEPVAELSEVVVEPSHAGQGEDFIASVEPEDASETMESTVGETETSTTSDEVISRDISNEEQGVFGTAIEETPPNESKENEVEAVEQDETAQAVASLQGIDMDTSVPSLSEQDKHEMEALRQAVESITDSTESNEQKITDNNDEEQSTMLTSTSTEVSPPKELSQLVEVAVQEVETPVVGVDKNDESESLELIEELGSNEVAIDRVPEAKSNDDVEIYNDDVDESESSRESVEINEVSPNGDVSSTQLNNSELTEKTEGNEDVLPDSSQSVSDSELVKDEQGKEHKAKFNERPRRHKKANDSRPEEDASDKEKPYSPKVTIKPIKMPEEEVSTTSNSDIEAGKGSLKMTITKQSDKMHSIVKVGEVDQVETTQEQEEPLPKLKIKSKSVEQSPVKMSTRSSRQTHQTNSSNASQRSSSPRITIKPLVKPETLSPLKIKIGLKTDDTTKKHSPKLNIKPLTKPEDEPKEMIQCPRKVVIKNIVKPPEEEEQTPKITIKPIVKPESEKENPCVSPKLNIKPIRKPEEEENDTDKHSPKITIKPIVKPPEQDSHSDENDDENKKRIVLKINKGNLPVKESRKREHPPDDDKAEKLAKITVKFSKEGGHPHIVQQQEETQPKRPHDDSNHVEKTKKQKLDVEPIISTRSKQKEYIETQNSPSESSLPESNDSNTKTKQQIPDNPGHGSSRGRHKDSGSNSPIEPKKIKLKESKQKDNPDTKKVLVEDVADNVAVSSPLTIVEDVPDNPGPKSTPVSTPDVSVSTPSSEVNTPVMTPQQPRKRGRPRKIPLEQREGIETPSPQHKAVDTPPTPTESGRPKRSCRGQSALDTLGLKPRKPRANKGGRGGAKAASGETRGSSMNPGKESKLSQAKLKLMQKAISEAGSVNVISVGTGYDKSVDIEDVLPQTQVEKRNLFDKIVKDEVGVGKIEVTTKPDVESQSSENKDFNTDGKNLKSILQQVIKSKLSEKEPVLETQTNKRPIEADKEDAKRQKFDTVSEVSTVKSDIGIKGHTDNNELKAEPDAGDSILKQELVKTHILKNQNSKVHVVGTTPSTSEEIRVPSSSTSLSEEPSEAMLVSDPIPQDASLPKSFGVSEESLLLAPESSSIIHSTVSSTSGPSEVVMVDEETRMSADTSSRAQTPAKQVIPMDTIEESQSSVQSTATTESGKASTSRPSKAPRLEVQEPEGSIVSPDQLAEYYWNGQGPYMLQEQVAHFLGIKSFKRKYPGIKRRMLEMQERDFIRDSGLVTENMCDLGLTAVNSADILDIMYSDFQDKYEEYCKHQRDRQTKELINKQKALSLAASQEKNKADLTENAKQSVAQWNANFNKARREQRRACMDLQTYTVHFPKGRMKPLSKGKPGSYPVALVPGQFTDYYKEFTPTEINNLPLNTMCYEAIDYIRPEESSDSGSDCSDSDSDSSSSSSGSDSSSSSGMDDCKLCKQQSPKKVVSPTAMK